MTYAKYEIEAHNLRWEHVGSLTTEAAARREFDGLCKVWPDRHFRIIGRTGPASKVLALYDARTVVRAKAA